MEWITPKTDWKPTDKFNVSDFNRIIGNTQLVSEAISSMKRHFDIEQMGNNLSYESVFDADAFNAIESNIDNIAKYSEYHKNDVKRSFYENGKFITYDELNRIESIILEFDGKIDGWLFARKKIPFVLGRSRKLGF